MNKVNKALLLMVVGVVSQTGFAATKTLYCSSGAAFEKFTATLDDSGFDPNSGFFDVTHASVLDNYASAQLTCVGNKLAEITCTGFWFCMPSQIVEVTLQSEGSGFAAYHHQLKGTMVADAGPWPCQVQ